METIPLYDLVVSRLKKSDSDWLDPLKKAHLFDCREILPLYVSLVAETEKDRSVWTRVAEESHLPFPITFVQHPVDSGQDSFSLLVEQELQRGMAGYRSIMTGAIIDGEIARQIAAGDPQVKAFAQTYDERLGKPPWVQWMSALVQPNSSVPGGYEFDLIEFFLSGRKHAVKVDPEVEIARDGEERKRSFARFLEIGYRNAFVSLWLATSPQTITIRETRKDQNKVKWKNRLSRRTRYLVLPKLRAMEIMKGSELTDEEISRAPHMRRAHYRTLRAARFRFKRGKRVLVKSHWVGPMVQETDDSRYEVKLEVRPGVMT